MIGKDKLFSAPVRDWVALELEHGGDLDHSFYIADWEVGFVGKIDKSDNVTIFATQSIQAEGWSAKLVLASAGYVYERDYDGEWVEYAHGSRPMVAVDGEAVEPVAGGVVEINGFRFTNLHDYNDSAIVAAVWYRLCELAGREPTIRHLPGIYQFLADPTVIREDRFVIPKRRVVHQNGVPLHELVVEGDTIVQKPLHRTFAMQDGTKVQIFVNTLSWKWPRIRSQRGRTWVESWEQRHAWRLEAMVANWQGNQKPNVIIPEKQEWHSFTDPWVLKEEPQRIWRPLLDLIQWLFEMPADQVQLVLEDGTRMPVLQEIQEPAWDRPPAHQLSHEEIEGGNPKIYLPRVW